MASRTASGLFCLTALMAFLVLPGILSADECVDCHDAEVTSPVHTDNACSDCHADVDLETHPDPAPDLDPALMCAQCHDSSTGLVEGPHAAISCLDCHGPAHEVLPATDLHSPVQAFNQVNTCGGCHDEPEVLGKYLESVHAKSLLRSGLTVAPSCSDCHGSHDVFSIDERRSAVSRQQVPDTCGSCHLGILEEWRNLSAHGIGWADGDAEVPVCTTCHASHEIVQPRGDTKRLSFPQGCGGCHEQSLLTYRDSFHGKVTDLGFLTAATCADCHRAHANLPKSDPRASIHPNNVEATCAQCHDNVSASFASFDPHSDPTDKERNALVYWVWFSMTGLLIGVFAFFTIHALLWLQRILVAAMRGELQLGATGDGPHVRRFSRSQIWTHVTVVVTFLLLAATGLPLKFHASAWAQSLAVVFGGVGNTSTIHRIAALATFGYFGFHLLQLFNRAVVRREPGMFWGWKSMVPQINDLIDLFQNLRYFLYLGKKPVFDRWTYWEKFDYFAVFWGVAVIGFSGLVLWLPELFTEVFPGWFLNAAYIVHSDEALLATGFIFLFHFFHTHLRPESFPLDPVIFTGRMPLQRFKEERPLEYQRLVDEKRLDEFLVEAPTARQLRNARVFGFTAVTVGLLLALGILVGLLTY